MAVIALGADHAGFTLKEDIGAWLRAAGHTPVDHGTDSEASVDYPDYALKVAEAVAGGAVELGILVCGSGLGMAIAANKVPGVRAAACASAAAARLSREHNDANVLALGARLTTRDEARGIVAAWLEAAFAGGRHTRRVAKIVAIEAAGRGGPRGRRADGPGAGGEGSRAHAR